jgi:hypothetical protein
MKDFSTPRLEPISGTFPSSDDEIRREPIRTGRHHPRRQPPKQGAECDDAESPTTDEPPHKLNDLA